VARARPPGGVGVTGASTGGCVALRRLALDSAAAAAGPGCRGVQAAGPHRPASGGLDWPGQSTTALARATVPVTAPSAGYHRWRASAPVHRARAGAIAMFGVCGGRAAA
jgi:hypothetical protein